MLFYDLLSIICIGIGHIYLFYLLSGNNKISATFIILLGVLFSTLLAISLTLTGFVELNVIVLLVFLCILGLVMKKHPFKYIIFYSCMSIVLFTVLKNGLFTIIYELYMDSPFNYYVWTKSAINFCALLIILVAFVLARNFIKAAGHYLIHSKLFVPSFVFVTVCTVLLLIVNYPTIGFLATINQYYGQQMYMIVLLIATLLMLIITISTYVSKERLIQKHEQSKQEQLMEYVEKLEFMHDELATFRHDYSNLLLSLEESIRANDLQQIKQIYEQTLAPTASTMNHQQLELTKLSRVQLPEVKSVLSVKILAAQRKHLKVHLDIPHSIAQIAMPMDQFVRIVSVLLDNATEGAAKSNKKVIQIALFEVNNTCYFVVKNSIDPSAMDMEQLYKKQYSTKGESRGYGLFSVQRIVNKYPHITLSTLMDDKMFSQELIIKTMNRS